MTISTDCICGAILTVTNGIATCPHCDDVCLRDGCRNCARYSSTVNARVTLDYGRGK